jgi:hypothetical protein
VKDSNEACDDGNTSDGDNCVQGCVASLCGDGFVDTEPPAVEVCDTRGDSGTCDSDCTAVACGDGHVNGAVEACDDGTGMDSSTCDFDCSPVLCDDGHVNEAAGEECDSSVTEPQCGVLQVCISCRCVNAEGI